MKKLRKIVKRYSFFLLLLLFNVLLLIAEPRLGRRAVSLSLNNLLEMLSVIPPIFLLLGLMDVWVPKETIMKFMGRDAGIKGGFWLLFWVRFRQARYMLHFLLPWFFLKKEFLWPISLFFLAPGQQQKFR